MERPAAARARAPVSSLDPFSAEFLGDPYPFYEQLREQGPVIFIERYGIWAMPRAEEVVATLTDAETFVSGRGVGLSDFAKEKPWRQPSLLLEADPPLHTRTRSVLNRVLSLKVLNALRPAFEAEAARLIEGLAGTARFDAMPAIAEAYPLKVFPDAVGLAAPGREHLLPYGDMAFNAFGPRNDLFLGAQAGSAAAVDWVASRCRRENLAPGGFGAEIYAAADRGELSEEEAPLIVRSLLTAGVDTTVNGIGAALLAFAEHPDQWAELRAAPDLARNAFDEALRLHSPVQTFFRTASRDVEVGGVQIPEGGKVLTFLGSANRDPRRWDEPDRYRIRRRAIGHVAFGAGIHACVGQMIARMEAEQVLKAMAAQIRSIELAAPPVRRLNNTVRALASLPLRVTWG